MPLTTSERFLWMAISSTSAPVHLRVPIHLNLFAFPPLLMASTLKNDPASSPRRKKRSISKSGWSTNVSNWAHFDGISFFVLLEKFELHWLVFLFCWGFFHCWYASHVIQSCGWMFDSEVLCFFPGVSCGMWTGELLWRPLTLSPLSCVRVFL